MTIKDKDNKIKIESICEGMVFRYGNDLFLMVEVSDEFDIDAVRLDDGRLCYLPLSEEVELVDCELVVK